MKETSRTTNNMLDQSWVSKRKRRKLPSGSGISNDLESNSTELKTPPRTTFKFKLKKKVDDGNNEGKSTALDPPPNDSSSKLKLKSETSLEPCSKNSKKEKGHDGYYYECVICDLGGNLLCCDTCPRTYHIQCLDPPLKRIPNGKWKCPLCCERSKSSGPVDHVDPILTRTRNKIIIKTSKNTNEQSLSGKPSQLFGGSIIGKKRSKSKRSLSSSQRVIEPTRDHIYTSELSAQPSPSLKIDDERESTMLPSENSDDKGNLDSSPVNEARESNISPPAEGSSVLKLTKIKSKEEALRRNIKKGKKRKREVGDGKKNRKSDEGTSITRKTVNYSPVEYLLRPKSKKKKQKSTGGGASVSKPKESTRTKRVPLYLRDELLPKDEDDQSIELEDTEKFVDAPVVEFFGEVQQVDRVLGRRLQVDNENSVQILPENLLHTENENEKLTKNLGGDEAINDEVAEITSDSNSKLERIQVYRRSISKETREVKVADILKKDKNITYQNESSLNPIASNEKIEEILENSGTPDHEEIREKKLVQIENGTKATPDNKISYEFLVKWVGKSHLHNSWIPESELKILAKRKLDNYRGKYGTTIINIFEERWTIPQRVIALRSTKDDLTEAFIKWTGLPYDECTWEREDEPLLPKLPSLIELFKKFEHQTSEKDGRRNESGKGRYTTNDIFPLTDQPKELCGALFPHQLEALNWLRKCWHRSKNVILADEMGLGKTVSAIAFISSLYTEFKAILPCLVLVPLSTMPNWMAEFSLWAPHINVVEYHGCSKARAIIREHEWYGFDSSGSSKKTSCHKFNVLLTTYEMILADSSHLRNVPWEVLIVDEGHRLKNSSSKLFSSLNTFSFQQRVLLTGTPLQNNLGELYNLLNFLQPASFPSLISFEEKFNDLTSAEKVEELKKLVAPHMLRRLKKDAMQNIPPKTERVVPVELSSIQAEYYRAMLTKNYQLLRNINKGVPQQSMLNVVMQLRKICNHPYLIPGTEPDTGTIEFLHEMRIKASAKLTLLHSMLKLLHKEGHRVLIFSQMTKLLDILEDYLTIEFGHKAFERVDGSVSVCDRQTAIARFNQDKSKFVFLLSTRACGLGINLATADTVIIYDSDFNPHADIQAMNRAHRIGQTNRLLVYRLVVRASVEERILQLAKKKLMLDQLFVNKSGSQKEVEDILKWGTEELFNDNANVADKDICEDDGNKDEGVVEVEIKRKRRGGGLGDMYKDKCTDGSGKIIWDENAIQKLLDRTDIQSDSPDNTEGDLENDMLGSVKSVEWDEEPVEVQGGAESPPPATADISEQILEREETPVENEWDRLLRVRWEKYQTEEEAALGRGKRQRKAVSYREAYAVQPIEMLNENHPEEEPEPEREYTSAGQALKMKYAALRARQKDRIAGRHLVGTCTPISLISATKQTSFPSLKELEDLRTEEKVLEDINTLSSSKQKKTPQKKIKDFTDESLSLDVTLQNDNLPVLGLYAPNADPGESFQRTYLRSSNKLKKKITRPEFPFKIAPFPGESSNEMMSEKASETAVDMNNLPNSSFEDLERRLNNIKSVNYPPVNSNPFITPGTATEKFGNFRPAFSNFREKRVLPKLPFEESFLPNFQVPTRNLPFPNPELMPTLSLGAQVNDRNPNQNIPPVPLFPNLKFPEDAPLGGPVLPQFSSISDNHRKVLENIMMRTGSRPSNLQKKKSKFDVWSEDELDFLWVGVRRHGKGNWETMLRDPRLRFSKYKNSEDLSTRWEEEQLRLMDGPSFTVPRPAKPMKMGPAKPNMFPPISDEMMARALHGSRLGGPGPSQFQNHLTDMKLGLGDLAPSETPPQQLGLPTWNPVKFQNFPINLSERPGTSSNPQMEQPFMLNSLGMSSNMGNNMGSLGFSSSKLPNILDRSLNVLRDSYANVGNNGQASNTFIPEFNREKFIADIKGKWVAGSRSSSTNNNKLPHWLREAVVPPHGPSPPLEPQNPNLPPNVTAIAQSVRMLYGEDTAYIPPFAPPGPPLSQPKDPRKILIKKKKKKAKKNSPIDLNLVNPVSSVPSSSPVYPFAPEQTSSGPVQDLGDGSENQNTEEKERQEGDESGDSSKTRSDPGRTEAEEVSSEGTVSDHRGDDEEL